MRNLPWIFIVLLCIDWNDTVWWDSTLAHWTYHRLSWLIHPSVYTWPAVKMPTLAYYGLFGSLQADVAFEHCIFRTYLWAWSLLLRFLRGLLSFFDEWWLSWLLGFLLWAWLLWLSRINLCGLLCLLYWLGHLWGNWFDRLRWCRGLIGSLWTSQLSQPVQILQIDFFFHERASFIRLTVLVCADWLRIIYLTNFFKCRMFLILNIFFFRKDLNWIPSFLH